MSPQVMIAAGSLTAVLLMMLAEWQLSRHNERVLRARGALEPGDDVYRAMAWAYPASFAAMALEGAWFGPRPGLTTLVGAVVFGAAKALKFWAIASLGSRWTFRVLVPPGAPLVARGPYAWLRHPNYVGVIGELVGMAMLAGARTTGPLAILLFAALLRRRVTVEDRMLGRGAPASRAWGRAVRAILPIFLATRIGVLAVGYFSVAAFGFEGGQAPVRLYDSELLNLPFRYDAGWYFEIAMRGYQWDPGAQGAQSIAFFPAFPIAVHALGRILRVRFMAASMLLTFAACLAAFAYLYRLAGDYLDDDRAAAAVALLATYPFSVFYSVPYTEALFLLSTVGAWWHVRRGEYPAGAIWGLIAGLTRPNGALLSIPLALMAWQGAAHGHDTLGRGRGRGPALAAAAMPGAGLLLFCAFIDMRTGNPFEWLTAHRAWGRAYAPLTQMLAQWVDTPAWFGAPVGAAAMADFVAGLFALCALALTVPIARRFGLAAALYVPLCVLPPLLAGGVLSIGRVTATVFPLFLWLGAVVPPSQRSVWMATFAMGQTLAAAMFFTWRPVF